MSADELITRLRKLNDRLYGGIETDLEEAACHIEALQTENARIGIDAAKEIVKLRAEVSKWMSLTDGNIKLNEHLTARLTALESQEPVAWQHCRRGPTQTEWQEWHTVGYKPQGPEDSRFKMRPLFLAAGAALKLSKFKLLAITTAYEQGVGKGKQGTDFNPYSEGIDEHEAWLLGYQEGKGMAVQAATREESMVLGDDEIESINDSLCGEREFAVPFARAILAAANRSRHDL